MDYVDKFYRMAFGTSTFLDISLSETCDPSGRAILDPQGHNLNKLGRGSLDDAKT